jgi:hypothetical protein
LASLSELLWSRGDRAHRSHTAESEELNGGAEMKKDSGSQVRDISDLLAFNPPRQLKNFSGPQVAVLFGVLALVALIPVITHPLPPLEDYINHLARMHVIATIGRDPYLARFYEVDWQIVPNLMMDMVVPVLARAMNVYLAGQLFTVAAFLLIVSGILTLNRALFGQWSVLPLIAFAFLYNYVFLVGVMNYEFGMGLALWALAFWVWLRERAWPLRFAVSTLFVVLLFFCHLFAVGLYGLGLLAYELWRALTRHDLSPQIRVINFTATGLPFVPVLVLLRASPTWAHLWDYDWEPRGKIDGLIYVIEVYSDIVAFVVVAVIGAAAIWAFRRNLLHFHPFGWLLLLIGCLIYLAMPRIMFATYMADQRLPVAVAFMLIACVQLELRHRLVRRGFLALLLVALVLRVIEVDLAWAQLSPLTLEFRDSIKRISPGSTVLIAYADQSAGDDVRDLGLVHAACLAMIERSALVTTAFTVSGKQIMHVQMRYREQVDTEDGTPPSVEQLVVAATRKDYETTAYWQEWQTRFDYVYLLFTEDEATNPAPDLMTLIYDGGRFQLYRINKRTAANKDPAPVETPPRR